MASDSLDSLAAARYISLTTYRADGSAVPTPVWVASDGQHLLVTTSAGTGKVRRLRADDRVSVAPCDARGHIQGPAVAGTAVVLEGAAASQVLQHIRRKYGMQARMIGLWNRLLRRDPEQVGLRITLT